MSYARYRPDIQWRTIRNDHVTIYFPEGHEGFAQRILFLSDEVYNDVTGYLDVKPRRTPLVLHPDTDMFNGMYIPFPNRIKLYETPAASLKGFGSSLDDLVDLVYTHEYTHFAHITTRRGLWGALTRIIGDGLAITNIIAPGWILEGVPTHLETKYTTGGRGRSPLFRSTVLDFAARKSLWGMSASGNDSPHSPPGGRIYHSGLFMIEYLEKTYGDQAFSHLNKQQAAHPIRGAGRALKHITKKPHRRFYSEYRAYVTAIADSLKNAAASKKLPAGRVVFSSDLDGCTDHFWTEKGTIIVLREGYESKTALIELDIKTGEIMSENPTGNLFRHVPVRRIPDGRLVFGGIIFHPFGDSDINVSDLVIFDPASKKHERLTEGAHIFSADLSPDGTTFAAVNRNGMWMDLVLIDRDGSNIRTLISKPGMYFQSPRWSPDGTSIAVTVKTGSYTDIALVNPRSGDMELLFASDEYGDGDPSFSPDGRWLVFTSSRDGVWNIHAWDMTEKRLFQLTSVFTAALEPLVSPDGSTLSFLVRSNGLNGIHTMDFAPHEGREIPVDRPGKPPEPDLARLTLSNSIQSKGIPLREAYKPFIHTPYIGRDEKGLMPGLLLFGGDPVGKNRYSTTLYYSTKSNRAAYDISLSNSSFWPVIDFRTFDVAQKYAILGGEKDIWFRKRGADISTHLDMINKTEPKLIFSSVTFGSRFIKFDNLKQSDTFDPGHDFSHTVYGEIDIRILPDHARRDMVPGWGQNLFYHREQGVSFLDGEVPGHNQIIAARQYIPSLFKHHGFELSLSHQHQEGRLSYSHAGFIPRGYDYHDKNGGFNLKKTLSMSLEYRFPLLFIDRGIGINLIHFNSLRGSFYADHGAGWRKSFNAGVWGQRVRTSIGATLTTGAQVFSFVPINVGLGVGYKVREQSTYMHFVLEAPLAELPSHSLMKNYRNIRSFRRMVRRLVEL